MSHIIYNPTLKRVSSFLCAYRYKYIEQGAMYIYIYMYWEMVVPHSICGMCAVGCEYKCLLVVYGCFTLIHCLAHIYVYFTISSFGVCETVRYQHAKMRCKSLVKQKRDIDTLQDEQRQYIYIYTIRHWCEHICCENVCLCVIHNEVSFDAGRNTIYMRALWVISEARVGKCVRCRYFYVAVWIDENELKCG